VLAIRTYGSDGVPAPESLLVELGGPGGASWAAMDISADGTRLVTLSPDGCVRLVDLRSGRVRELGDALPPLRRELGVAQFVSWSQDGDWIYFSGGGHIPSLGQSSSSRHWYAVWRRSLYGATWETLWESENIWPSMVQLSPDGHHVAFNTREWENDVWMIEDF
jgi:hypothetical protein